MRAVLDTNVLVRCTKNASGPARECFRRFEVKQHVLLVSHYLLAELARVLTYPRVMAQHGLSPDEIRAYISAVEQVADVITTPLDSLPAIVLPDPDDDPVVLLAVTGKAQILCTRDRHLRLREVIAHCSQHGIQIVNDVELLRMFKQAESEGDDLSPEPTEEDGASDSGER
jgi:putative PIN family toxin of toxin-antitoxin system